ncbi:LuxR C-terminal-related transcriptional regulator, partial [Rhizobium brockwellii]
SRGLLNKQVANQLGLSEITVKLYRGGAMRKMHAQTLAQLVRMIEALERGTLQPHTPV